MTNLLTLLLIIISFTSGLFFWKKAKFLSESPLVKYFLNIVPFNMS